MGDRFYLEVICSKCGLKEGDVYYAPTCGFVNWTCPQCKNILDLEKYTGISYEDCSNADMIKTIYKNIR